MKKLLGRRRKLFVDRLQLQLLSINVIYTATTVLVFVTIVFGPLVATALGSWATAEEKSINADRMLQLHGTIWPAVLAVGLLFSFHSLLYTHRIAGPLYSLRRTLTALGNGNLRERARVRSRDYLHKEAEVVNCMIDGLRDRVRAIRDASEDARRTAHDLAATRHSADPVVETELLDRLGEELDRVAVSVDAFQLPDLLSDPPPARAENVVRETAVVVGVPDS